MTYGIAVNGVSLGINLDPTISRPGSLSINKTTYWLESLFPQTGNGVIQRVLLLSGDNIAVTLTNYVPNISPGVDKFPLDAVMLRLELPLVPALSYADSNSNVVGTNCNPPQSPAGSINDWHLRVFNIPPSYSPTLLSGPSGGFWRVGACSSNGNWPLGVGSPVFDPLSNTYTWDLYAEPYPGILPQGSFQLQFIGPNNATITVNASFP